jgi:hypothetical protein
LAIPFFSIVEFGERVLTVSVSSPFQQPGRFSDRARRATGSQIVSVSSAIVEDERP